MEISFDPAKRAANLAKHGLDLADAGAIFERPRVDEYDDRFDYREDRWITYGLLNDQVVLCIWAERGDNARIISLRKATIGEQEKYFREAG